MKHFTDRHIAEAERIANRLVPNRLLQDKWSQVFHAAMDKLASESGERKISAARREEIGRMINCG